MLTSPSPLTPCDASQALARLGGSVTGVDASREAVGAARMHAQGDESLRQQLDYRCGTAEELQARGRALPPSRLS